MSALAARLTAPPPHRCKFQQILDRLDDDDRAAIEEWKNAYLAHAGQRGVRYHQSPGRLAEHLLAARIVVSEFTITRHFDGTCRCTKEVL